jgi:hypothetical protein
MLPESLVKHKVSSIPCQDRFSETSSLSLFQEAGYNNDQNLEDFKRQLLFHLNRFFFFKVNAKEEEIRQYLLRTDYQSMNNKTLADWFRNFVRSNLTV